MPFKSQAQRRYMYKNLPEIAERWEKETPKGKKLPTRIGYRKKKSALKTQRIRKKIR